MNRTEILEEAKKTVTKERVSDYGTPEESLTKIAQLWSVYLNKTLTPVDAATMMILLKVARTMGGSDKIDNMVDIAGYAACAGELMSDRLTESKNRDVSNDINRIVDRKHLPVTVLGEDALTVRYTEFATTTKKEG